MSGAHPSRPPHSGGWPYWLRLSVWASDEFIMLSLNRDPHRPAKRKDAAYIYREDEVERAIIRGTIKGDSPEQWVRWAVSVGIPDLPPEMLALITDPELVKQTPAASEEKSALPSQALRSSEDGGLGQGGDTRSGATPEELSEAFKIRNDDALNLAWWREHIREANKNGLIHSRKEKGKNRHALSYFHPHLVADWLIDRKGWNALKAVAALRKHFPHYEPEAEELSARYRKD